MKPDGSFHGKGRAWVPPTITKFAIGTETKSPVTVNQGTQSRPSGFETAAIVEPQPPTAPAQKFGFALEWSFPLSARAE